MKSTAITVFLGLSLTLGAAGTSRADDQQTIRIPQGRGQYLEIHTNRQVRETNALFVKSCQVRRQVATTGQGELRPVTVTNAHGSTTTLFRRGE